MHLSQKQYKPKAESGNVSCHDRHGVTVIAPLESIVLGEDNGAALEAAVRASLRQGQPVVLDASRVEFFENAAIETLLEFESCAAESRTYFVLCGLNEAITEVFRIAGLDCLFQIFKDVERAVRCINGGRERPRTWH